MQTVIESANPSRITSANNGIMVGSGGLMGIFVAQATGSPTITVYDGINAATGKILVNTFTPIAGTFYPMPFFFTVGLFVVLGGTVDCTVGYGPVSG